MAAGYAIVSALIEIATQPLGTEEIVLSVDETTSLWPRPHGMPMLPAQRQHLPNR